MTSPRLVALWCTLLTACGPEDGASDGSDTTGEATGEPTTGEPAGACADLVAPAPANTFATATLVHALADDELSLLVRAPAGDNTWFVRAPSLGAADPAPGVRMDVAIEGEETAVESSSGVGGTVTLEFVAVTPDCATLEIRDLELAVAPYFIDVQLPGGFVAARVDE